MFLVRGLVFSYEAVRGWEAKLTPILSDELRQRRGRRRLTPSWYVDETYIKARGRWCRIKGRIRCMRGFESVASAGRFCRGHAMNAAISSVPARSLINISPPTPAVFASSVGLPPSLRSCRPLERSLATLSRRYHRARLLTEPCRLLLQLRCVRPGILNVPQPSCANFP